MLPLPALPASTLPLPGGWVGGWAAAQWQYGSQPPCVAGWPSFFRPAHPPAHVLAAAAAAWLAGCVLSAAAYRCARASSAGAARPVLTQRCCHPVCYRLRSSLRSQGQSGRHLPSHHHQLRDRHRRHQAAGQVHGGWWGGGGRGQLMGWGVGGWGMSRCLFRCSTCMCLGASIAAGHTCDLQYTAYLTCSTNMSSWTRATA